MICIGCVYIPGLSDGRFRYFFDNMTRKGILQIDRTLGVAAMDDNKRRGAPETKDHRALRTLVRLADPAFSHEQKVQLIDELFSPGALTQFPELETARHVLRLTLQTIEHAHVRQEQLKTLAYQDDLTGLPNRRSIDEQLEQRSRSESAITVIMVDIDKFKAINDSRGHNIGDEVLTAVAQRIASAVRGRDYIGRWGGEEFIGFLDSPDDSQETRKLIKILSERIRCAVCNDPIHTSVGDIEVSVSIGAAMVRAGGDILAGMGRADRALYKAKNAGRNRVVIETKQQR